MFQPILPSFGLTSVRAYHVQIKDIEAETVQKENKDEADAGSQEQ